MQISGSFAKCLLTGSLIFIEFYLSPLKLSLSLVSKIIHIVHPRHYL